MGSFFGEIAKIWDRVDFVVHAIAFSDKEELKGLYLSTTRQNFLNTMAISCYSFTAIAQHVRPLMTQGGSLLTMTYGGSGRVMPHYNVMGVAKAALESSTRYLAYDLGAKKIRVNCISAGPVQTLAARGISGFSSMMKHYEEHAPLKRSCETAELGATGVFLASAGAASIPGQVIYVDGGYEIMGM
jgi:enoyl-[acyl-carrier protein] reductase I